MADLFSGAGLLPLLNALLIGVSVASIWLVAALGLTIIYGTMRVINLAHGEFIMLGAYTTWALQQFAGFPWLLCLPVAFFVVAAFGWAVERGLIRHLYERPLDTLLATFGLSLILVQGMRMIAGGEPQYVSTPGFLSEPLQFGTVTISTIRVFIFVMAGVLVALTWFLYYKTRVGVQIRAVMQNKEIASAFGVPERRIYSIAFAYGAGLAGIAGAMFSGLRTVFPDMGLAYVVEAFLVVVLGGGAFLGTVVSAGVMGETFAILSHFSNDTLARFWLFIMIVVLLRFRPEGLLGGKGKRR